MLTVGDTLKKIRLEKNISLEEIEKATKIRKKYLIALEENDRENLPPLAFVKGFIKNYSEYLGIDSKQMMTIYRREYDERKSQRISSKEINVPMRSPFLRITPNSILAGVILFGLIIFFGYLFYQYRIVTLPPQITISSPKENEIFKTNDIIISGKTNSDNKVLINNQNITVEQDGSFNQKIEIHSGINKINIKAINKRNLTTTITRMINGETP
jgi:cytoskeleton protein RodZ